MFKNSLHYIYSHMTESITHAPQAPSIGVQRTYLKGASLETPMGTAAFILNNAANLNINIGFNVSSTVIAGVPDLYESVLRATLTATQDTNTVYLLEVDFAAILEIKNATTAQLEEILETAGPQYILPYLRVQVSDFLLRATLPVFNMPDVNWAEMRAQRLAAVNSQPQSPARLH